MIVESNTETTIFMKKIKSTSPNIKYDYIHNDPSKAQSLSKYKVTYICHLNGSHFSSPCVIVYGDTDTLKNDEPILIKVGNSEKYIEIQDLWDMSNDINDEMEMYSMFRNLLTNGNMTKHQEYKNLRNIEIWRDDD